MNRIIYTFSIILLLLPGCTSRKNKLNKSEIIPADKLTDIITDLYLTDGIVAFPKVRQSYQPPDTLAAYRQVIEKHGYTKEAMDRSLKYYFVKKPKKLGKIYDQALARLSSMESKLDKQAAQQQASLSNLWKGPASYHLPSNSKDSTSFDINMAFVQSYTLTFTMTLYNDDTGLNPQMSAYVCNADSVETGKRRYFHSFKYIKDGLPHRYSITITPPDYRHLHVRGCLYAPENHPGNNDQHFSIEKISFATGSSEV